MAAVDLYLIRHGLAGDRETFVGNDELRPLTPEGEKKTRRVAKRLQELNLHFDLMLTSPYLRAKQTAEILQEEKLAKRLEVAGFLSHQGSFSDWLDWLGNWRQSGGTSLALVGHEPDLSQWAELLLWGDYRGVITFKKAGVMGITLPEAVQESPVGNGSLFWLVPPRLLL